MSLDITTIGLFHCKAGSDEPDETETIQVLEKEDILDYPNVNEVVRDLLGVLKGKNFVELKNARVHSFTPEANDPRDISATSTKELLSELQSRESTSSNMETLASWYLQTDYAQSGLLVITHFITNGHPQIGIIKAPFMDDVYEPDDDQVLSEMDQVIKGDLKKGILYPRITPAGEVREEEACVYQAQSSDQYPKHWFEYLHLEPSRTSTEVLSDYLAEEDENPLDEVESTEEFEEIVDELENDLHEALVTVEIGGVEVRVELGDVLRKEGLRLTETDSGYQVVITGQEPKVKFWDSNERRKREILRDVKSYDDLEEIIS